MLMEFGIISAVFSFVSVRLSPISNMSKIDCNTSYIVSELYTNKVELILRKFCTILFMLYNIHCGGSAWFMCFIMPTTHCQKTNAHLEQPWVVNQISLYSLYKLPVNEVMDWCVKTFAT